MHIARAVVLTAAVQLNRSVTTAAYRSYLLVCLCVFGYVCELH
ncbi:unnamed protein product [Onchocerca flexuosa]|uniref:Uncharacterized protein n=1 Tax=Onchocerca flexuosa TaxID=387005 RepID=A0A183H1V8_9BILA|nr:unnamed protein product [Onchocerca flexuosa]